MLDAHDQSEDKNMGDVVSFPGHPQRILNDEQRELVILLGSNPDDCATVLEPGKDARTGKSVSQLCAVVLWRENLRLILPDGSMVNVGPND